MNRKLPKTRVRRGWGAFYRRGGALCQFFNSEVEARAAIRLIEASHVLRAAPCEVRELTPRKRAARKGGGR